MNKHNRMTFIFEDHVIVLHLPRNYHQQTEVKFPFILLHDGDYLFRKLDSKVVMVGIQPINRNNEYTPWPCTIVDEECSGDADNYLDMLERLIQHLRNNYRLSENNDDVGIGGGSYGGLVSFYALLSRPQIAGKYFLLSPSVWYPRFEDYVASTTFPENKFVYWYVGLDEGKNHPYMMKNMVPFTLKLMPLVKDKLMRNNSKLIFVSRSGADHHHRYFKKYFKKALKTLGWL